MTLYVCISKSQPRPHMSMKKHAIEPHMMNFLWAVSLVLFLCLQLFMFSGRQMVAVAKGWRNFIGKIYQAEKTIYGIFFFLLIEKRWPSLCLVGETKDSRGLRLRPRNEACMWKTKPQVHLRVIPTLQHAVGTPKKEARSSYSTRPKENLKVMKRMSLYHGPMATVFDTHNLKEATKMPKHCPKGTSELGDRIYILQG